MSSKYAQKAKKMSHTDRRKEQFKPKSYCSNCGQDYSGSDRHMQFSKCYCGGTYQSFRPNP
jgi:hypothetical protein